MFLFLPPPPPPQPPPKRYIREDLQKKDFDMYLTEKIVVGIVGVLGVIALVLSAMGYI